MAPPAPPSSSVPLRYALPLERAGEAAGAAARGGDKMDHRQGSVRVRVLEAEGLASRADGSPCEPYVTVAVAELLRKRARRTVARARGPNAVWEEAFDFEGVSACSQIVVDVWDRPAAGAESNLLGKVVLELGECRPGVPHTYFKRLLEGNLVLRVLFDFEPLPADESA